MDPDVQWYLARDGKQHGPLASAELRKLIELGHLKPTDLLWRQGFADWRPAPAVFQSEPSLQVRAPQQPGPQQPQPAGPRTQQPMTQQPAQGFGSPQAYGGAQQGYGQPQSGYQTAPDEDTRGAGRRVLVAATFMLLLIGAGTWLAYQNRAALVELASSLTKQPSKPAGNGDASKPAEPAKAEAKPEAASTAETAAPAPEAAATPAATDAARAAIEQKLAATPPWPLLKTEFPDWYGERVGELAKLSAEGKSEAELSQRMVEQLVDLRRKNVDKALAASTGSLKGLAQAFVDNLKHLTGEGPEVCYGFISKGESSPGVVALMQSPEKSGPVNAQFEAIFKAIVEGKTAPVTHASPVKSDYTVLTAKLQALGWTQSDIQLFANSAELSKASHDRVCKMVQDWFTAHLAIEDAAVQERLLIETLRPVVGS